MSKKIVKLKNLYIGDGNITIQSMTNTDSNDYQKTKSQVKALIKEGADIVRIAVCSANEAKNVGKIAKEVSIPIVADIQFDYKLAICAIENGVDKIRINPGNIGDEDKLKKIIKVARINNTPIRVGVNSGSIEKEYLQKYGNTPKALASSALHNVFLLEKNEFNNIIISAKTTNVRQLIETYEIINAKVDYPLHIGLTESGRGEFALVKSSIGIGALILKNIGDTIRVSLTDNPLLEIKAAKNILRALGIDNKFCEIISCPTCSRCKVNLKRYVIEAEKLFSNINKKMKIAIMGCVVNGPGEAKDADYGIAFFGEKASIFRQGIILFNNISKDKVLNELNNLIKQEKNIS